MAETKFMKTVTYGGYDKDDVLKQFAAYNLRISELKNQLEESRAQLNVYKSGGSEAEAYEAAMAADRAKLSEAVAQNETFEGMLRSYEDQISAKDDEIKTLHSAAAELSASLADANAKITAMQGGDEAMALSNIFLEAQKTGNNLKATAKAEADKVKDEAMALAEDIVRDANNEAAKIVYEAEKNAAIATANAQNDVEQMNVATNNMRAAMLENIEGLTAEVANIKAVLDEFSRNGLNDLVKAQELITGTENTLKSGGVPKFQQAKTYSPKLPQEPKYIQPQQKNQNKPQQPQQQQQGQPEKKKNSGLENLQKMANSIGGDNGTKKGGIDLSALQKQADSMGGKKQNKGGIDLSALQKQAESLGKK